MAYLFRNNIKFHIFSGDKKIKISTKKETIGNNEYSIIYIDGERTSITTNMGLDWEPWMIIREIWSNALDEGEAINTTTTEVIGVKGYTSIYIEFTPAILEVYNSWNNYFITNAEPLYDSSSVSIYPAKGKLRLYKQGILIHTEPTDSLFNYDIKNARLNELREYKGMVESDLMGVITSITDPKTIEYFLEHLTEDHYEGKNIDYSWWSREFNSVWKETLKGAKIIHTKAIQKLQARGIKVDGAVYITVPEALYKGLSKHFEGIGALRVSKAVNDFFEIYNEKLHDKIAKAKGILEKVNYFIEPELTFVYGVFGDKRIMAKIDLDQKKIYISEKHIDTDMFTICTMLIEENEHYKTGLRDETRGFQQHFINLYTNSIIEKSQVDVLN